MDIKRGEMYIGRTEIADEHDGFADSIETAEIGLEKTDIRVAETKLVWVPVG
jgi:hypothetical protein